MSQELNSKLDFNDHLKDLFKAIKWCFVFFIAGIGLVHLFHKELIASLIKPVGTTLQFLSPLDPLYFIIKVDILFGFILALPFMVFITVRFVSGGDVNLLKGKFFLLILSSMFSCLLAAFYAYKIVIPLVLKVLSGIVIEGTTLAFTASSYLSFVTSVFLLLIIIFQIPILLYILIKNSILKADLIKSNRRYIYTGSLVLTAVITPTTDVVSLLLTSLPLVISIEVGLLISR